LIAALVIALASAFAAVGFEGAKIFFVVSGATQSTPVVDAATLGQARFVAELRPIHTQIEQSVLTTGLVVAAYEQRQITRAELQRRLAAIIASYRDAASRLDGIGAPPALQSTLTGYVEVLSMLQQSGDELSKAYDDGDQARVAAALAASLQATARFHDLLDAGPPARD
jgi:hypothetical protein